MANAVNWFEIPAVNLKRAVKFYREVLDAELQPLENNGLQMAFFPAQDDLDKYLSYGTEIKSGIGATRKVDMKDGKNRFEEKCIVSQPNESLAYELTACSFPIHQLRHTYSFEKMGSKVKVKQIMEYEVKFGWLGKILDALVVRKQSDNGIKKFFFGLKNYLEH